MFQIGEGGILGDGMVTTFANEGFGISGDRWAVAMMDSEWVEYERDKTVDEEQAIPTESFWC